VATLVAVGTAERLMGSRRTAIAFVATGLLASVVGVGLVALGVQVHEFWSTSVHGIVTLDPLTPIAGTWHGRVLGRPRCGADVSGPSWSRWRPPCSCTPVSLPI
jgi:hypothetical protein